MTDYALDDVIYVRTNVGSLSEGTFIVGMAAESSQAQPRIVSYKRYSHPSVLAHQMQTDTSDEECHGAISRLNAAINCLATEGEAWVVTNQLIGAACENLVRWTPSEGYDFRNVAVARSGTGIQNYFWANRQARYPDEPPVPTQVRTVLLSEEVIDFCYQYQISNYLQIALRIARRSFSFLQKLDVTVEHDREGDDEWLGIIAEIRAQPDSLLAMYNDYNKSILDAVPWPARDKIRLIYDIV